MFQIKKGEYAYIKKRKLQQLGLTFLMLLLGLSIYGTGYVVNGFQQNDICLVLGILMVLPGAKFMTTFILLLPYHTPEREEYEQLKAVAGESVLFWSDLVITSTERAMGLDYLYIGNGCVYGLSRQNKQDLEAINAYLLKGVRNWGESYRVEICDTREAFQKRMSSVARQGVDPEEEERVVAYLYSLIV